MKSLGLPTGSVASGSPIGQPSLSQANHLGGPTLQVASSLEQLVHVPEGVVQAWEVILGVGTLVSLVEEPVEGLGDRLRDQTALLHGQDHFAVRVHAQILGAV